MNPISKKKPSLPKLRARNSFLKRILCLKYVDQNIYWNAAAYKRFWGSFLLLLLTDQISKWAILKNIPEGGYPYHAIPVLDSFFYLVQVHNPGAAWGCFSDYGPYLALLAILVLITIYYLRKSLGLQLIIFQYAFAFLCAGIIGNLIDRIWHGYVIDFIDIYLPGYHWPTFNIADLAISTGVGLYFWGTYFSKSSTSIHSSKN